MLAGKAYLQRHNQVSSIVSRNICTEYALNIPGSKWTPPPKMIENDWATILWVFRTHTDKMLMPNHPDIFMIDKYDKRVIVVDVAIPSDRNIKMKTNTL